MKRKIPPQNINQKRKKDDKKENKLQSKIDIYIHCNKYVSSKSKMCALKKRANETCER